MNQKNVGNQQNKTLLKRLKEQDFSENANGAEGRRLQTLMPEWNVIIIYPKRIASTKEYARNNQLRDNKLELRWNEKIAKEIH